MGEETLLLSSHSARWCLFDSLCLFWIDRIRQCRTEWRGLYLNTGSMIMKKK